MSSTWSLHQSAASLTPSERLSLAKESDRSLFCVKGCSLFMGLNLTGVQTISSPMSCHDLTTIWCFKVLMAQPKLLTVVPLECNLVAVRKGCTTQSFFCPLPLPLPLLCLELANFSMASFCAFCASSTCCGLGKAGAPAQLEFAQSDQHQALQY